MSVNNDLGYEVADLRGRSIPEITHPDDVARSETEFARLLAGDGSPSRFEKRYLHRDGASVWASIENRVVHDERGRPLFTVSHVVDMTEQRRNERLLRESAEFLQKTLDALPAHIAVLDERGHIVMVNEAWSAFARSQGNNPDDCSVGVNYLAVCDAAVGEWADGAPEVADAVRAVLGSGASPPPIEYPCHSPTEQRWFELRIAPLDHGGRRNAIVVHVNTSQRRAVEEALRSSERTWQATFDAAPIGIELLDADGRILRANPACVEMAGVECEEVLRGYRLFEHSTLPADVIKRAQAGETVRYAGRFDFARVRERNLYPTGRTGAIDLDVIVAPLPGDGQPAGYLVLIEDITEKRRLESELRRAQKLEAIGQLAGGVAHDFNNILTAILGNVSLIEDELRSDEPSRHAALASLRLVEESGQRAAKLTRQLLAFSRKQVIEPRIVDLNDVIRGMHKMLRRLISESIRLELQLDHEPLPVYADAGQLEQVLMNLIVNARDAIGPRGVISIVTMPARLTPAQRTAYPDLRDGPFVALAVADNGAGMDAATRDRVFEPFFTTKPVDKGTGLGLSTVYGIIKQAGGEIEVESQLGRGSVFRILLPREQAGAAEPDEAEPPPPPGGSETILLCEDDETVQRLTGELLRSAGYDVLATSSAADAVRIAQQHALPIDLLVADVVMPETNGKQLAENLASARPGLRTLFISGYPAEVLGQVLPPEAGIELLPKPFSRRDLLKRVRDLLDEAPPAQHG